MQEFKAVPKVELKRDVSAVLLSGPVQEVLGGLKLGMCESLLLTRSTRDMVNNALAVKPHMFHLADILRDWRAKEPFTSFIIDDTSARFLGHFIRKAVDPESTLSVHFLKAPGRETENRPVYEAEIRQRAKSFGAHPCILTEYISEGTNMRLLCQTLRGCDIQPTVATLHFDFGSEYPLRRRVSSLYDQGARAVIMPYFRSGPPEHLYGRGPLNGVVSHEPSLAAAVSHLRIKPWPSALEPESSGASSRGRGDTERLRKAEVRLSRALVRVLAEEYHEREPAADEGRIPREKPSNLLHAVRSLLGRGA